MQASGGATTASPASLTRVRNSAVLREGIDDIAKAFGTLELGPDDVDLVVCTDAEEILGIGAGGMCGIQAQDAMWQPVYPSGA